MKRMGFSENMWEISEVNKDFKTCATYPQVHIFPSKFKDGIESTQKLVEDAAKFRAEGRFPSVVWRHPITGAVLIRSSQPQSGLFNRRSNADEDLLKSIARAASVTTSPSNGTNGVSDGDIVSDGRLLVMDARSYKAALGNWMKGGGVENQGEYSP